MTSPQSSGYPTISLAEAVRRIEMVYNREHDHSADKLVIAKAMNYSSLNGSSYTTISALIKYGLLETAGDQYKVSPEGIDISRCQKGNPERIQAIQKVAFIPPLFQELHVNYGDVLPSDDNLRAHLIKRNVNPNAVDDVIRAYRGTIEFVKEETQSSIAEYLEERQREEP